MYYLKQKTTLGLLASAIVLSFVAAIQLETASSLAYAQGTSFPNPPPPPTITEANCIPSPDGGVTITIKIENLDTNRGYEYTLEVIGEEGLAAQNVFQYQEGDPIVYTGSEVPEEYPEAFFTKELTLGDFAGGRVYLFTFYQGNVVDGELVDSVTLCDTSPPADTEAPLLTVPDPITVQATTANGGTVVTFSVTAEDDVDGTATLEEDGATITQDEDGGDIAISCDRASGTEFSIGETPVDCKATDAAGNTGDASFSVTVNPPPPPTSTPAEATDELITNVEELEDVPQSTKTSLAGPLRQASNSLNDDNPNNDESACGNLGAFVNQVNANERRGSLTTAQADDLRTDAEDIRSELDC